MMFFNFGFTSFYTTEHIKELCEMAECSRTVHTLLRLKKQACRPVPEATATACTCGV